MNLPITEELLSKHNLTQLSAPERESLQSTVLAIVANRLAAKIITTLTEEQIDAIEALPRIERAATIMDLAEKNGLYETVPAETNAALSQIANRLSK